jgi:hypothetical protein
MSGVIDRRWFRRLHSRDGLLYLMNRVRARFGLTFGSVRRQVFFDVIGSVAEFRRE